MNKLDFGNLTQEETIEVLKEGFSYLTDDVINTLLNEILTYSQKEDLAYEWIPSDALDGG